MLPLDDRRVERFNADLAGRPQLIKGKTQLLFGGMGRLSENSVLTTKNKSHAITANVTVPDGGAEGVIIAQGGAFAGWSMYAKDGTPKYCYNLLGLKRFTIEGDRASAAGRPPGTHGVRLRRRRSRQGRDRHAVRRRRQGRRRSPRRDRARWSSPVTRPPTSAATPAPASATSTATGDNEFTGTVHWVQIDIDDKAEDFDHLITPEERWQIAMARQ